LSAYDVTIINSFPQLQSPVRYQGLVLLSPSGRPSTWLEAASFQPLLLALRTADPGAPLRTAPGTSLTGLVDTLVHYSRHYDAPDARRALLDELGARSAGSVLRLVRAAVGRPAIEGRGTEWGGRWLRAGALRPRVLLIAGEDGYYYDVGGAAWGLQGLAWIFRFSIFGFRICFVWMELYRIWVAG
jgi:pimeloyl-ACP methyl ester carboxylesterase